MKRHPIQIKIHLNIQFEEQSTCTVKPSDQVTDQLSEPSNPLSAGMFYQAPKDKVTH